MPYKRRKVKWDLNDNTSAAICESFYTLTLFALTIFYDWMHRNRLIISSFLQDRQNSEWNYYINKMLPNDKEKILSFLFEDDQKRCFVSIMMQRAMIRKRLGAKDDAGYTIEKTREVCCI